MQKSFNISILAYAHCWGMQISIVQDIFKIANLLSIQFDCGYVFQVNVCGLNSLNIMTASHVSLTATHEFNRVENKCNDLDQQSMDLLVIPAFSGPQFKPVELNTHDLVDVIQHYHQLGVPILTFTTASYFVARSNCVSDQLLATYWAFKKKMQQQCPHQQFTSQESYLYGKGIYSTGDFIGGISALLHSITNMTNPEFAQLCATHILVENIYELKTVLYQYHQHKDQMILKVQRHLEQHQGMAIQVSQLAQMCTCSERNLQRRFVTATGISIIHYCQELRMSHAKKLMMTTNESIQNIAYTMGYENTSFFIRLFKRFTGMTPKEWRMQH